MFGDDAEREAFFEHARLQAQKEYEADNTNTQALVRWGGALLELAHYKNGSESRDCIQEGITRLKQALQQDPERTDAEWCLGNAYTSLGFLSNDKSDAMKHFDAAEAVFKKCKDKEPTNETYRKALEMCKKAPEYYDEIQAQIASSSGYGGGGSGGSKKKPSSSDFWWDVAGWVTLGALLVGAMVYARSSAAAAAGGGGGGAGQAPGKPAA